VRDFKLNLRWHAPIYGVTTSYTIVIKDGAKNLVTTETSLLHVTLYSEQFLNGHNYEVEIRSRSEMFGDNQYIFGDALLINIFTTVQGCNMNILNKMYNYNYDFNILNKLFPWLVFVCLAHHQILFRMQIWFKLITCNCLFGLLFIVLLSNSINN